MMQAVRDVLRFPSLGGLWERDNKLLMPYASLLDIAWWSSVPSEGDYMDILGLRHALLEDLTDGVVVGQTYLDTLVDTFWPQIQRIWNVQEYDRPRIEIVGESKYIECSKELERNEPAAIRQEVTEEEVPEKYLLDAMQGIIYVPDHVFFSMETQEEAIMIPVRWKDLLLEQAVCEALTLALHRQVRNEWKEQYYPAFEDTKKLYIWGQGMIGLALATMTKEILMAKNHPFWGIYIVGEKIMDFYRDEDSLAAYCIVDRLVQRKSFGAVCMVDQLVDVPEGEVIFHKIDGEFYQLETHGQVVVRVGFNPNHPNHKQNLERYHGRNGTKCYKN
jgi:hypothetical protein